MHLLLTIRKGQEHGLVITKDISDPHEFMYSAYMQALDALREIVLQSKKVTKRFEEGDSTSLYGYAHNIITFSGSRGQGKTSAMISFSQAIYEKSLQRSSKKDPAAFLQDYRFTVLPPIDPTVLEENQSILAVILSRMYRLAEESWQKDCSHSEGDKNSLLAQFQRCLSGINAIKFRKGEEIKNLHAVHEISDSSLLKENFYELTKKLLQFTPADQRFCTPFLVIQLDDTDFQIRKGYEILEDIRKYLTIPNVIILMATDLHMLHHSLLQHYADEFKLGLDKKLLDIAELQKLESKYLDKLIPPTFTVYLPHLDDVIRQQGEFMQLTYVEPDEEEDDEEKPRDRKNLLLPPVPPEVSCRTDDFTFQSLLLRYVYRKTRIVFAEPSTYAHDLIPTTLRGLSQFLGLLCSMENVPSIQRNDPKLDDPHELAKLVENQVKILEINLPLFENYFLNDWVHTKLPKEKSSIIEQLVRTLPEQRCQQAVTLLEDIYHMLEDRKRKEGSVTVPLTVLDDYTYMIWYIEELKETHRQKEDFYLFFAIRTFFTIQFHKEVVRQKKRAILSFRASDNKDDLLLFDFSPKTANLPTQYLLFNHPPVIAGQKIEYETDLQRFQTFCSAAQSQFAGAAQTEYAVKLLFPNDSAPCFNILNLIGLSLSLGSEEGRRLVRGEHSQRNLYLAQTSAATIAINWDVQDLIYNLSKDAPIDTDTGVDFIANLRNVLNRIDREVRAINRGANDVEPMILSRLEVIVEFIINTDSRTALHHILRTMDEQMFSREDYLSELCEIYDHARKVRSCVTRTRTINVDKAVSTWNALVDVCRSSRSPDVMQHFDLHLLSERLKDIFESDPDDLQHTKQVFGTALSNQMRKLYKHFGYTVTDIEAALKRKEEP